MCELAPHLQSLGALMPAPPPGGPGPFALCGRDALQDFFAAAGLEAAHIEARQVGPDGTFAIRNPFRYAVSTPIA